LVIVDPQSPEEALNQQQAQFAELIQRHEGKVLESFSLGRRRLSFRIGRFSEGTYLQFRVELPPAQVANVRKAASLLGSQLRLLMVQESLGQVPAPSPEGAVNAEE